jgi:DNA repair protein RecN (Recombination protein N)
VRSWISCAGLSRGRLCTQRLRKAAAGKLAKLAEAQINSLAMKVRFEVAVTRQNEQQSGWTANGWDQVEYRIATNPGEPLKPLDEIASGGEMSA